MSPSATDVRLRFSEPDQMTPSDPSRPLAISYLRFSTPDQEKGDSYRRQTQAADEYAEKHGLELTEDLRFEDRGVSAFRGRNTADGELKAITDMVEKGVIPQGTYLLVEGLDRLSRMDPFDASYRFQGLIHAGLVVVTLADGAVYSKETMRGPDGVVRMFASLMIMSRANEESLTESKRLSAANEAKRKAAYSTTDPAQLKRLTRIAPAWLSPNPDTDRAGPEGWLIVEEKAEAVRRVFELGRQRMGKEAVARMMDEEGVPPLGRGNRWHASYVHKLWTNPAVIGTHTPHRMEVSTEGRKTRVPEAPIPGYFPAIVSEELWADIQALRTVAKPRGATSSAPVLNPLAGVGKCGRCGSTVTRIQKGKRSKPSLVCTAAKRGKCSGPYTSIHVERVELALQQQALHAVATAPLGEGTEALEEELANLQEAIGIHEADTAALVMDLAKDPTPAKRKALREAEAFIDEKKMEEEDLQARIVQNAPATVKGRMAALERLLANEDGYTPGELSEALQRACEAVVVDWDAKSLVLRWRQGGESQIIWGM